MASVPIKVPSVGESISEGILARWLKPDGGSVKAGEPLFELETDKASSVVPAPSSGVLKIGVAEGETVAIGATVGTIDPAGTPAAAAAKALRRRSSRAARNRPLRPLRIASNATASTGTVRRSLTDRATSGSRRPCAGWSPRKGSTRPVAATGPGGRVTKGDVLAYLESPQPDRATSRPLPRPRCRSLQPPDQSTATAARETRQRMSGLRQKIAQRLVEVQQTAAILTTFNEADMSRVMELRTQYKEPFQKKHGVALGFMSFFIKAAIEALKAFPAVNARIEGNEIVFLRITSTSAWPSAPSAG